MAEHGYVSVPIAAKHLGVSERTVRYRARNGDIDAMMVGRSWLIRLPPIADGGNVPTPAAATADGNGNAAATVATGGNTDLMPLARLLDDLTRRHDDRMSDLTRQNRQLAEAAAVWQFRAMQAEERLKALTAGGDALDASGSRSAPLGATEAPNATEEPRSGFRAWWARLWGGS